MNHKEQLLSLLGLANSATDEEIALANSTFQADMVAYKEGMDTAIANAKGEADEAKAALTNAHDEIAALKNRATGLLEELANRDVVEFKAVISDAAAVKEALIANRESTVKFLNGLRAQAPASTPAPAAETPKQEPLHNNRTASQPAPITSGDSANSEADAKWVSNRTAVLRKTVKGLSHRQAFDMARGELANNKSQAQK